MAIFSQRSFLLGERRTVESLDQGQFNSAYELNNYIVLKGGGIKRRHGSKLLFSFDQNTQDIINILKLGDYFIVLYSDNTLKVLGENSVNVTLTPQLYIIKKYDLSGNNTPEELTYFTIHDKLPNQPIKPINIKLAKGVIWVILDDGLPFVLSLDEEILILKPYFMDEKRLHSYDDILRSIPFNSEQLSFDNPFYTDDGARLAVDIYEDIKLVIDANSDLDNLNCKAWLALTPSKESGFSNGKIDVDRMNLSAYIGKPLIFNVYPKNPIQVGEQIQRVPVTTTVDGVTSTEYKNERRNDWDSISAYTGILKNLNDLVDIASFPFKENVDNNNVVLSSKAQLLRELLYGRKYMIIPKRVHVDSALILSDRKASYSSAYPSSEVIAPAIDVATLSSEDLQKKTILSAEEDVSKLKSGVSQINPDFIAETSVPIADQSISIIANLDNEITSVSSSDFSDGFFTRISYRWSYKKSNDGENNNLGMFVGGKKIDYIDEARIVIGCYSRFSESGSRAKMRVHLYIESRIKTNYDSKELNDLFNMYSSSESYAEVPLTQCKIVGINLTNPIMYLNKNYGGNKWDFSINGDSYDKQKEVTPPEDGLLYGESLSSSQSSSLTSFYNFFNSLVDSGDFDTTLPFSSVRRMIVLFLTRITEYSTTYGYAHDKSYMLLIYNTYYNLATDNITLDDKDADIKISNSNFKEVIPSTGVERLGSCVSESSNFGYLPSSDIKFNKPDEELPFPARLKTDSEYESFLAIYAEKDADIYKFIIATSREDINSTIFNTIKTVNVVIKDVDPNVADDVLTFSMPFIKGLTPEGDPNQRITLYKTITEDIFNKWKVASEDSSKYITFEFIDNSDANIPFVLSIPPYEVVVVRGYNLIPQGQFIDDSSLSNPLMKIDGSLITDFKDIIKSVGVHIVETNKYVWYVHIDESTNELSGLSSITLHVGSSSFTLNKKTTSTSQIIEYASDAISATDDLHPLNDLLQNDAVLKIEKTAGVFYEFKSVQTSARQAKAYAECAIFEIGIPSPVEKSSIRVIGGNDYDLKENIVNAVFGSLSQKFIDVVGLEDNVVLFNKIRAAFIYDREDNRANQLTLSLNFSNTSENIKILTEALYQVGLFTDNSIIPLIDFFTSYSTALKDKIKTSLAYKTFQDYLLSKGLKDNPLYNREIKSVDGSPLEIISAFASFSGDDMYVNTNKGIYTISLKSQAVIQSQYSIENSILAFNNKIVFMNLNGILITQVLSRERLGLVSSYNGINQTHLLDDITSIIYSSQEDLYLFSKRDGSIVSALDYDKEIVGFTKWTFPKTTANKEYIKVKRLIESSDGVYAYCDIQVWNTTTQIFDTKSAIIEFIKGYKQDLIGLLNHDRKDILFESSVILNTYVDNVSGLVSTISEARLKQIKIFSHGLSQLSIAYYSQEIRESDIQFYEYIRFDIDRNKYTELNSLNIDTPFVAGLKIRLRQNKKEENGIIFGLNLNGDQRQNVAI